MRILLLLYAFILPIISLLWANSLYFSIDRLALIVKVINVTFFIVAATTILVHSIKSKIKGRFFFLSVLFLFLMGIFYSLVGLINGFTEKILPDFYTLVNGPLIAYAIYQNDSIIKKRTDTTKTLSRLFLFSLSGCVTILLIEGFLGIPFYPALASAWAVLPFFVYVLEKKYTRAVSVLIILFLAGKRSILGLGLAVLSVILFWRRRLSLTSSAVFGIAASLPLAFLVFIVAYALSDYDISAVNKLNYINPLSEKFDVVKAAGERFEEVTASIEGRNEGIWTELVGMGNGYVYELKIPRKDLYEEDRHNVHFTPVNLYTKYGIVFSVLYYSLLIFALFRIFRYSRRSHQHIDQAMSFYLLFGILSSLISFSLPLDYLFWYCLGILLRVAREAPQNPRHFLTVHKEENIDLRLV